MTRIAPSADDTAAPGGDRSTHDIDSAAAISEVVRVTAAINRVLRVAEARLQPTIDAVVRAAMSFTGFDVGLSLLAACELVPQPTTDRGPHELDLLQRRLGLGPAVDAISDVLVMRIDDMKVERRWGSFAEEAAAAGVSSMVCVPLTVDSHILGTLSLFGDRPHAFSERDHQIILLCASLASSAISDAQRSEQLRGALARRDVIGQAKGVLMAQHHVTADQAFDLLRQASQRRNEKLFAVAESVAESGLLP